MNTLHLDTFRDFTVNESLDLQQARPLKRQQKRSFEKCFQYTRRIFRVFIRCHIRLIFFQK